MSIAVYLLIVEREGERLIYLLKRNREEIETCLESQR